MAGTVFFINRKALPSPTKRVKALHQLTKEFLHDQTLAV